MQTSTSFETHSSSLRWPPRTPAFLGPLVLSSETQLSSPQTPFWAPVWKDTVKSQSRPDSLQIWPSVRAAHRFCTPASSRLAEVIGHDGFLNVSDFARKTDV